MQVTMMGAAQRHRELIADLEAEASWLREAQVMGVRRLSSAHNVAVAVAALRARDAACQFETGQAAAAPELFTIPMPPLF